MPEHSVGSFYSLPCFSVWWGERKDWFTRFTGNDVMVGTSKNKNAHTLRPTNCLLYCSAHFTFVILWTYANAELLYGVFCWYVLIWCDILYLGWYYEAYSELMSEHVYFVFTITWLWVFLMVRVAYVMISSMIMIVGCILISIWIFNQESNI